MLLANEARVIEVALGVVTVPPVHFMVQLEEAVLLNEILLRILIKDHLRHTVTFPLKNKLIDKITLEAVPANSVRIIQETSPQIHFLLPQQLHLL